MVERSTGRTGSGFTAEVEALLASWAPARRTEGETLIAVMGRVTGQPPVVNGAIVGFGSHHYRYASGREGDTPTISFAVRKAGISIYFVDGLDAHREQLDRLGPHKAAVSCLTIKKLDDVDLAVLESMIAGSYRSLTT